MQALNLSGHIYGNLTVIKEELGTKYKSWICSCICGNLKTVMQMHLRSGGITSCGCIPTKRSIQNRDCRTPLYSVWSMMKNRILNPNSKFFHLYGGRGLTLCPEWYEFIPFKEWALSSGYKEKLTIDRKNNNLGYFPNNCRWVTRTIQSRNIRKYKGKSKYLGVSWDTSRNVWIASITINNKRKWLGQFIIEDDAAKCRDNYIQTNNLPGFTLNNG